MFSLDDETIEKGGDDILASQGDLGQLLFSAAAGLADLGGVLDKARAAADAFHKKAARKSFLAEARKTLKVLEREIREIDLSASRFRALRAALEAAETEERAARMARDCLLGDKARLAAIIECLPLLVKLKVLQSKLERLAEYSGFQTEWPARARDLREREVKALARRSAAQSTLAALHEKRARINPDPAVLSARPDIEHLMDAPRSRAVTAQGDLPKRRQELADLDADIDRAMNDLGLAEVAADMLAEPVLGRFERLAVELRTARETLARTRDEAREASAELDEISGGIPEDIAASPSVGDLRAQMEGLQPEALVVGLHEADAALDRARNAVTDALANLVPWQGQADQLPVAPLTQDQARRIADEHEDLKEAQQVAQKELDKVTRDLAGLEARLQALQTGASAVSDLEKQEARGRRDALWETHLQALSRGTADSFHAEMLRLDAIQDAQAEAADRLARMREVQVTAADLAAQKAHLETRIGTQAQTLVAKRAEFARFVEALGLPAHFDPRDLAPWLSSLAAAHRAVAALVQAQGDQTRTRAAMTEAEAALRKALNAGRHAGDLTDLTRLARQTLEDAGRKQERARAIRKARAKLERRTQMIAEMETRLASAEAAWRAQTDASPLPTDDPSGFLDALPTLRKLGPWLSEREKLRGRIAKMQDDVGAFNTRVQDLNARLGGEPHDQGPVAAQRILDRLKAAEQANHDLRTLDAQTSEQETAQASAEHDLERVAAAVAQMAAVFPVASAIRSPEDLQDAVAKAQDAAALRKEIADLQRRITLRLGAGDFADARKTLEETDVPGATARLQAVEADLADAEARLEAAIGDLRAAQDALAAVGGDDAVAGLQGKRQVLLLDIAEQARQSLRVRLGVLLAEQALARYRERHRSAMLTATEQAFTTLTAGRYARLVTQPDGQNEALLAVRAKDNRSVSAARMSKGTRFQLYLALRLAGYAQFVEGGTQLPFIADDIMETFDNARTAAALDLLGQISRRGQALYFTHHEHVVDLARERLGDDCHIHDLSAGR